MKTLLTLLFGLIISPVLFAQYPGWENITNTNKVMSLCNDKDTLWIGTFGGLVKYNKKTSESYCYNRANASLPTNSIRDLAKDNKDNLWIAGQYNGIGCFFKDKCKLFNESSTSVVNDTYCKGFYIDKNDTVFISANKKLYRIFANGFNYIKIGNPIMSSADYVNTFEPMSDGSLVASTTFGLYCYKNGTFTLMYNNRFACNVAKFDLSGNLWVGTNSNGLYKYKNDSLTIYNSSNSVCPDKISDCFVDKNSNVWISSNLNLINFKESGNSEIYSLNLSNDFITCLSNDDSCVWVGTYNNGLYRFKNGQFDKVPITNQGLPVGGQLGILNSKLQVGSSQYDGKSFNLTFDAIGLKTNPFSGIKVYNDKGIFTYGDKTILGYFENHTWRYYDQFTTDYIKNIVPVSPDTFWVSTTNRGLLKYENGQVIEFNNTNSPLPNNSLWALTFDTKNVLWGSFGYATGTPGIFSFDGINWHIWTAAEAPLLSNQILNIKFDSKNNLWCNSVGNAAVGVIRFNGTNWTNYLKTNSLLPSDIINNIFIDSHDTIWVATSAGAAKFDRENTWEAYTISNSGMTFSSVLDVIRLSNGDVYFTHSYGGISVLKSSSGINDRIPNVPAKDDIKLYPIPAQDMLNIQIPTNCTSYKIEIYDLSTKPVYSSAWYPSTQTNGLQTINSSSFPKGIYLLQLKTDNKIYSKKVIIR